MNTIDAALAAPAFVGDVETFDAVFDREYAAMVRLAFLLVDSNEVAEEVVQDAFARLHERWSGVANPGAYLRTSVVNRARDVQRRRQRERRMTAIAPEHATLGADHLLDALQALPPKRRAALVLRYYDDLSEAEIASVLGVRPGTVKSMLHRGLAQLREVIER